MQQNSRIDHWQDVLNVCREFWLTGSGIGTYRYVYRPYESQVSAGWFYHAENQYLESFVETGIVGFSLIAVSVAISFLVCLRLLGWRRDPFAFAVGIACFFAICTQAIHSFFDFGLYMPSNAILFAAFVGIASADVPPADATDEMWVKKPGWFVRSFHGIVCVGSLAWVIWGGLVTTKHAIIAESLEYAGELVESVPPERGLLNDAVSQLEKNLAKTSSCDADARVSLAKLYVLKYRSTIYEDWLANAAEASDEEKSFFWQMTSPLLLHRRAHQLKNEDRKAYEELLGQSAVIEFLRPAISQLRIASCCCPIVGKSHVAMAQIGVMAPESVDEAAEVQTAIRLAPNDPDVPFSLRHH